MGDEGTSREKDDFTAKKITLWVYNECSISYSVEHGVLYFAAEVCIPGYEDESEEAMELQIFNCMLPGDYHEEVLKLAKEVRFPPCTTRNHALFALFVHT